ncbi:MAG TPA: zinc-ribbon domain-containing protein, partial [Bryobacteraceae bacterium]
MAFCTQCGTQVGDTDVFCAQCGAPQRGARGAPAGAQAAPPFPPPPGAAGFAPPPYSARPRRPHKEFLADTTDDHVAGLCYIPIVGW